MLSEKQLDVVQGGWFIDIIGAVASIGAKVGTFCASLSFGSFSVADTMGQRGTMQQYSASLSPAAFGTVGLGGKQTSIRVLNSSDMRDLTGVKLAVGLTAQLPKAVAERMDIRTQAFAIAFDEHAMNHGGSVEASVPIVSTTGRDMVSGGLISISKDSPQVLQVGGVGFNTVGVQLAGTLQFSDVKVTQTTPSHSDMQSRMDLNQAMRDLSRREEEASTQPRGCNQQ